MRSSRGAVQGSAVSLCRVVLCFGDIRHTVTPQGMATEPINACERDILDFTTCCFSWSPSFLYSSFLPVSPLSSKSHTSSRGRAVPCSHAGLPNTGSGGIRRAGRDGSARLPSPGPFSEAALISPGFPWGVLTVTFARLLNRVGIERDSEAAEVVRSLQVWAAAALNEAADSAHTRVHRGHGHCFCLPRPSVRSQPLSADIRGGLFPGNKTSAC